MAVLGKRKAPESSVSEIDANELLRRHFEARFQPLEASPSNAKPEDIADDSEDSEWGGLSTDDEVENDGEDNNLDDVSEDESDDNDAQTVEIVDHSAPQLPKESMSKRELKAFMSSRPPDQTRKTTNPDSSKPSSSTTTLPEDAPSLLKQDLELRRLLAESHLLAPHAATKSLSSVSSNTAQPKSFATGRTRQKATDLRIQALGAKVSIHKQEKMPMHIRKGMTVATDAREAKRRREARENGVILERETGKKKRRERGRGGDVDRPGVGRLRGAELRISERDVRGIESTRDVFGRKGRR